MKVPWKWKFRLKHLYPPHWTLATMLFFSVDSLAQNLSAPAWKSLTQSNRNECFSPIGIEQAYGVFYLSADTTTSQKMQSFFGFSGDHGEFARSIKAMNSRLNRKEGSFEMSISNRVWVNKAFPIRTEFNKVVKDQLGSEVVPLDVASGVREVNTWIKSATRNRIPEILTPSDISVDTVSVVANAVYFKGKWKFEFDKSMTSLEPFYVSKTKSIDHPFMTGRFKLRYVKEDQWAAVELPYKNDDIAFISVIPNERDGFQKMEEYLSESNHLQNLFKKLNGTNVSSTLVSLPKFSFETLYDIGRLFQKKGFSDGFFPKLVATKDQLDLTVAKHKTFIKVDEEGAEASAATVVVGNTKSASFEKLNIFRADRPFNFYIVDKLTGTVIFWGRVVDPKI